MKSSSSLERLSDLLRKINISSEYLKQIAELYPSSKRLQSSIHEYLVVVVGFCGHMLKFTKKSWLRRFISTLSDNDIKSYQSNITVCITNINYEAGLEQGKRIEEIHEIAKRTEETKKKVPKNHGHRAVTASSSRPRVTKRNYDIFNQDRCDYWVANAIVSELHLNAEDQLLLRLRVLDDFPWSVVTAAFEREMGKKLRVPYLQMKEKRLRDRIKACRTFELGPTEA